MSCCGNIARSALRHISARDGNIAAWVCAVEPGSGRESLDCTAFEGCKVHRVGTGKGFQNVRAIGSSRHQESYLIDGLGVCA